MKKLFFTTLLITTSILAFSQEQPKPIQHNQFSDYVQFQQEHQFRPEHFPMHPKPERVIFKKDKVIVIFKREDFMRLRPQVIERIRERRKGNFEKFFEEKMSNLNKALERGFFIWKIQK